MTLVSCYYVSNGVRIYVSYKLDLLNEVCECCCIYNIFEGSFTIRMQVLQKHY